MPNLALPMEDVFITRSPDHDSTGTAAQNTFNDNEYVEFAVYPPMTNTIPDLPHLQPDDIVVFKVGKKKSDVQLSNVTTMFLPPSRCKLIGTRCKQPF